MLYSIDDQLCGKISSPYIAELAEFVTMHGVVAMHDYTVKNEDYPPGS